MFILLDESGDLGWTFTAPYRRGGSSRYLTIASIRIEPSVRHVPKRLVRKMYDKYRWPSDTERKWADLNQEQRIWFARKAAEIAAGYAGKIKYLSITVKKENVMEHIRSDPNKLYNYMIGISLLWEMSKYDEVRLYPDARGVKVGSGNSLHDYLQTKLWFDRSAKTKLETKPCDSSSNRNIQFADMLAGLVQNHFEDGNSEPWRLLHSQISYKTLFF